MFAFSDLQPAAKVYVAKCVKNEIHNLLSVPATLSQLRPSDPFSSLDSIPKTHAFVRYSREWASERSKDGDSCCDATVIFQTPVPPKQSGFGIHRCSAMVIRRPRW